MTQAVTDAHVAGGSLAPVRRKRVILWIDEVNADFLAALRAEGVEVAAVVQASHPGVPSISVHDLYYGSGVVALLPPVTAPAGWIDAEEFRTYARCIQRIGFYPGTKYFETVSGGVAVGSDLEDWARVHLSHALQVLEGVSADEVWFSSTPHVGVDNMLALAAIRSGRRCLVFTQVKFAPRFSWKQSGAPAHAAPAPLQCKARYGGAMYESVLEGKHVVGVAPRREQEVMVLMDISRRGHGRLLAFRDVDGAPAGFTLVMGRGRTVLQLLVASSPQARNSGLQAWIQLTAILRSFAEGAKVFGFVGGNSPLGAEEKHRRGARPEIYYRGLVASR